MWEEKDQHPFLTLTLIYLHVKAHSPAHVYTHPHEHNIYTNRVTYVRMYKHKFYIHIAFYHYSGLNESHIPPPLAHLLGCLVARCRTAREFLVGVGFF